MVAAAPFIAEFGTILLTILLSYGSVRVYGTTKTALFIGGAVLWATIVENIGVLEGAYSYTGYAGTLFSSYPGYFLWVGLVPLWVELGWIVVMLSLFLLLREVLLPGWSPIARALLAGLLAVNVDAIIDPIAVANRLWLWLDRSYYTLGVPFYNWAGWFLLVFFYTLTFEYTVIRQSNMVFFGRLERLFARNVDGSVRSVAPRFAFRLFVVVVLVSILLTIISNTIVPPG